MIQEQFVRNTNYCERYGLDYQFFSSEIKDIVYGGWDKVYRMQDALKYDLVIWLDADAIIFDTEKDLKDVPIPEDSIGAVRFSIPVSHLNVGVLYIKPGEHSSEFVSMWLSEFPGQGSWHEQEAFNRIRNDCVVELPQEWNRNYDHNPFANPVVMGFHGYGEADYRIGLMRKVLERR
jgi:hypothetical protein